MTIYRRILGVLVGLLVHATAVAEDGMHIDMSSFEFNEKSGDMVLDMNLVLNHSLEDAINGGIELSFLIEMNVLEQGWLTSDTVHSYSWRAKVRRHQLGQGYEYKHFGKDNWNTAPSILEALADMEQLRLNYDNEKFLRSLRSNAELYFEHRLEVILGDLPNPLQVELLTSSEWHFSSGWQRSQP